VGFLGTSLQDSFGSITIYLAVVASYSVRVVLVTVTPDSFAKYENQLAMEIMRGYDLCPAL
jgi:hypothetical protein